MRVITKLIVGVAATMLALVAVAGVLYLANAAPTVPPLPSGESARAGKPYVVKIHAQWCYKCMMTMDVWSRIERTYGDRVNLVVFDFTNQQAIEKTEAEARRVGLEEFYDSYAGTGSVQILDRNTKQVRAVITGSRDFDEYTAAIDAALGDQGAM